jgi:hypothetical protein
LGVSEATLGKDFQSQISLNAPFDFPQGVSITVTSSDPSRLSIGQYFNDSGSRSVVLIGSGGFYINALASSGDVTVTLTATGYSSRSLLVHLIPTTFRLTPATVTTTLGDYARFTIVPTGAGTLNGYLRNNLSYTFALSFSNPSILTIDTPVVTFQGYYGYVAPIGAGLGTTTVTLTSTSAGVVDPLAASATVTLVPKTFSFSQPTLVLGKNLERLLPQLSYPNNPGIIQLRSSDASRVLLSRDAGLAGSETLDSSGPVYVQALADSGDVTITASAAGYTDTQLRVRLYPAASPCTVRLPLKARPQSELPSRCGSRHLLSIPLPAIRWS